MSHEQQPEPETRYTPTKLPDLSFPVELYDALRHEGFVPEVGSEQGDEPLKVIYSGSDTHTFIRGFAAGADLAGDNSLAQDASQVDQTIERYEHIAIYRQ